MTNERRVALSVALLAMAAAGAPAQQAAPWEPPVFSWYFDHHPEIAAQVAMKTAAAQMPRAAAHPAASPSIAPGTFTTFDAPGAVADSFYAGTKPVAINRDGAITGTYQDASFFTHGFIRAPDGTITTIDVPGDAGGTYPVGIDEAGDVAGYYCDTSLCHGFWYSSNGTFTTFDAPGAIAGTYAISLDSGGGVTGYYWDKNYSARGFVRAANGTIKTFNTTGAVNGTYPLSISASGIAGVYEDASYALHGFAATRAGMTSFDPPGQLQVSEGLYSFAPGIGANSLGMVAGYYYDPLGQPEIGAVRGFIRDQEGRFATFDAGPVTACCLWTMAYAINDAGVVTGSINDDEGVNHGFLRAIDGAITFLDAPGAGTGNIQGTVSMNLNAQGVATGIYIDANFAFHGFVYQP